MRPDRILPVDPARPNADTIEKAAKAVASAGVVVFPTRCLYGLGVDAFNAKALEKVFHLKKRPPTNPILVLIRKPEEVMQLAAEVSGAARRIMENIWPGRATLVFAAKPGVPDLLTAGTGKIGIRLPGHPAAAALVAAAGRPITGTSANIAGEPGAARIEDLPPEIADHVDLILDAGSLEGGAGSTVIDVSVDPPRILREGAASAGELEELIGGSAKQGRAQSREELKAQS